MQPSAGSTAPAYPPCQKCGGPADPADESCPSCGQVLPQHDPLIGQLIAEKYRILSRVAIGGTSTIYRAEQEPIRREVALKVMHVATTRDPASAQRFKLEAEKASQINHPNAVTIYDFGDLKDGTLYLAMEFVKGKNLREVLLEEGTLPEERIVWIIKQVCEVLAQAHRRGIIHRDLKPDNIMIEPERSGRPDWVVVLDFGIAKTFGEAIEHLTMTGNIVGTPHYMSPEQCEGKELDARSDIYALGILMYEMLTGKVPFDTPSSSVIPILMMHVQERPKPLRVMKPDLKVSHQLEKSIMRALAKERNWRQSDAAEMLRDLRRCEESEPAAPVSTQDRTVRVPISLPPLPHPSRARALAKVPAPVPRTVVERRRRAATSLAARIALGLALVSGLVALRISGVNVSETVESPRAETPPPVPTSRMDELLAEAARYQAAGNPLAAMDPYREVLRLDRTSPDGLLGLAATSEKIGNSEQAEAYYGKFLEEALKRNIPRLEPQILMARNKLGEIRDSRGLIQEAARLRGAGELPEALSAYRRYLTRNPSSPEAHLGLGEVYLEQKRFQDALEALDRACQLDGENAEAFFRKGLALYQLGRFSEAAGAFEETLRISPDHADAAHRLDLAEARARARGR